MNHCVPSSSAQVDLVCSTNETFGDSIQFDPPVPGVTGPAWTLSGQSFRMDIKPNHEAATLLSVTSPGEIITDDVTQRIIHFNVPESVITAAGLIPGCYIYDFVMFDGSTPPIRVQLMHGRFTVTDGITGG